MIKQRKKAFSSAEVLVTIMLFSFGILPLIVLFQNSHKQTAQAKNLMIAQSIGRTMISEIRSMGYDLLDEEIETSNYGIMTDHDYKDNDKVVPSDDNSIVYPEYYKRFKVSVDLTRDKDTRKDSRKIIVKLDVKWQEPDRSFILGFGTVVVKYDI